VIFGATGNHVSISINALVFTTAPPARFWGLPHALKREPMCRRPGTITPLADEVVPGVVAGV
jgi:hypothetical protein